ncbi:MAG: ACP S-malonyltransferase [Oscillospiraceae bacterium]|jgi:[acyl-carrier-protein] S-malonyltransferase|nr:ACP S-malonyltransferase [Oscillospiraceae bacterium]
MKIFLFPGQGTQKAGMERLLLAAYPDLAYIYNIGSEILGYDLRGLTDEDLTHTKYAQPAIFACSVTSFKSREAMGDIAFKPFAVAGHSLGEFSAMVASEVLTLEDGFKVIKARAEAMEKCAEQTKGAMVAVLKLPVETIETVCNETEGFVTIANYNSDNQTVIAGEVAAVNLASEKLKELKGRCVPLKTAGAFHTKLMQPAADEYLTKIDNITFNNPTCEFYSNVTGKKLSDFTDFKALTAKHIVSPVRFAQEVKAFKKDGCDEFFECEPSGVLTKLIQ